MQTKTHWAVSFCIGMLAASVLACSIVGAPMPERLAGVGAVSTSTSQADLQPLLVSGSAVVIEPINASSLTPSNRVTFDGVYGFTWLPEGDGVALAGQQDIIIVEPSTDASEIQESTPQQTQIIQSDTPSLLTAAREIPIVAWISAGHDVNVLATRAGTTEPDKFQSAAPVTGLALSDSGEKVSFSTFNRMVFTFDSGNTQDLRSWTMPAWLTNLSYSPDGSQLAGVDPTDFRLYFLDAATGQIIRSLNWPESPTPGLFGVFLSPDWSVAAWVSQGGIQLMNTSDGDLGPVLLHQDAVNAVAWSPDGRLLASAAAEMRDDQVAPVVFLWDAESGRVLNKLYQPVAVSGLSFSPDGRQLGVLNADGGFQTWSVPR